MMSYGSTMKFLRTGYAGMVGGSAAPEYLCSLLCTMRAAYLTYRNAHWMARGTNYYGLHLLFERLYTQIPENIDKLAEQMVGTYGSDSIREDGQEIDQQLRAFAAPKHPLGKVMLAVLAVQEKIDAAHADMSADGNLTPGWDDVLSSLASANDNHLYLVQQASWETATGTAVAGARRGRPQRAARPGTTPRGCCGWQYMGPTYGMICVKPCHTHEDPELTEKYETASKGKPKGKTLGISGARRVGRLRADAIRLKTPTRVRGCTSHAECSPWTCNCANPPACTQRRCGSLPR